MLVWFRFMVFKVIFNNISVKSWLSVFLVEETGVREENNNNYLLIYIKSMDINILMSSIQREPM
jgi:hypothetical protein